MSPRNATSPYRYDRAAIRIVLETHGLEVALASWPPHTVNPIARVLGLTPKYKNRNEWKTEWTPLLGTKPDIILAGELGMPSTTVIKQRQKLGIQAFDRKKFREGRRQTIANIPASELVEPLDQLRKKYGVSFNELIAERTRREMVGRDKRGRRKEIGIGDMRRVAVLAIKDAYPFVTLEQIGEAVGCTRERVRQILYFRELVAS